MAYVVTLVEVSAPPRYDGVFWTQMQIEESVLVSGPWTLIDTKVVPTYPDAEDPPPMSFTTELATLLVGYYRLTFFDATGDSSLPSDPIPTVSDTLAAALVYTTIPAIRSYAPELVTYSDSQILAEAIKAQRDIDWYAGFSGVINEVSGLRFDPVTDLNSWDASALNRATCAQVQYRFYMGPAFSVDEMQYAAVEGRDQTVRGSQRVGPQARSEFPRSLRKQTGRFA